jgi:hypothetical protein
VAALLSRPLFDSASYGQIRSHHRRVFEYLAAQWIRRRMAAGCPTRALEQLLFDDGPRIPAPRRTLIPVIAWLCNGNDRWNDAVRSRVQRGAPEILLEYGDAEALPLEFKRALLTAWIERNRAARRSGLATRQMRCGGWQTIGWRRCPAFSVMSRHPGISGNCWYSSFAPPCSGCRFDSSVARPAPGIRQ